MKTKKHIASTELHIDTKKNKVAIKLLIASTIVTNLFTNCAQASPATITCPNIEVSGVYSTDTPVVDNYRKTWRVVSPTIGYAPLIKWPMNSDHREHLYMVVDSEPICKSDKVNLVLDSRASYRCDEIFSNDADGTSTCKTNKFVAD